MDTLGGLCGHRSFYMKETEDQAGREGREVTDGTEGERCRRP